MANEKRGDRSMQDDFTGYQVYDMHYEKIGKVDDVFVDENDEPGYIGMKVGLLGSKTALIPMGIVRINDRRELVEVAANKDAIEDGPTFGNDGEITPEFQRRVLGHYGVEGTQDSGQEGVADERVDPRPGERAEDQRAGEQRSGERYSGEERSDWLRTGESRPREEHFRERHSGEGHPGEPRFSEERSSERRSGQEHSGERRFDEEHSGERRPASATRGDVGRERGSGGEDELRVERVEEELRVGTREREAGAMNVRKRVRTERERLAVPTRREEVRVERVPVDGRSAEAPEAEIGEDDISIPVVEEEVVVEKRPVVKEEIRIRKDVVNKEEVIEEDVRKEEVEIDDQTRHGGRPGGSAGRAGTNRDDQRRGR